MKSSVLGTLVSVGNAGDCGRTPSEMNLILAEGPDFADIVPLMTEAGEFLTQE